MLNPENVCRCEAPKGAKAMTCPTCQDEIHNPLGRPQKHTDEDIIDAIARGATTPDKLLAALGLKHKTTLIKRLRGLREAGRLTMVEGARRDGFRVSVRRVRRIETTCARCLEPDEFLDAEGVCQYCREDEEQEKLVHRMEYDASMESMEAGDE
jgi:hypothetical protein